MKYPARRLLPSIVNLNTFEVIARRQSITAAADELGLTQSAVSRQLADLEAFVGVALCTRSPTGLELTREGRDYLRRVRSLLDELEAATISASLGSIPERILRISVPTTFGAIWAMPRLAAFARAHPDLQLDVATHTGPVTLRETGFDAAIVYCEGPESGCVGDLLHPLHSFAVAAPSLAGNALPLSGAQIAALPLLHQSTGPNSWPSFLRQLGAQVEVPMPGPLYGLLVFALQAAEAGLGAALLPEYVCGEALRAGRLVKLHPEPFTSPRSYFFVTTQERAAAPSIAALRAWLLQP
jgi:DNA-binding transcriptional LysR family regulator